MDKFLFQKLKSNQKKPQILENGFQLVAICHLTLVSGKLYMNLNVLFYQPKFVDDLKKLYCCFNFF